MELPPSRPQRPHGQRDSYGNWLTHGAQVEEDAGRGLRARRPRRAASRPSTPPTSTPAAAPRRCSAGRCKGERREGLEIFTKVYWPTGRGPQRPRPVAQAHHGVIDASLRRLQTDYVDLYQAHRYDYETPLEETMQAFADVVRAGKALYVGVSEWTRRADPRGQGARRRARTSGSSPTSRSTPRSGGSSRPRSCPTCRGAGHRPDRLVADRAGRADRQVPARARRRRRARAPPTRRAAARRHQPLPARRRARAGAAAAAARRRGRAVDGRARGRLGAAEPQRLLGDHRRHPARAGARQRQGGRRAARPGAASSASTRSSRRSSRPTPH